MYPKLILLCLIATLAVAQQNINENDNILSSNNERFIRQLNQAANELNPSLAISKTIVVIGGATVGDDNGKSVEAYDFQAARWNRMPQLPSIRDYLCAATLNGKVYAIGGSNRSNILHTVDVFDFLTQTWTSAPNMNYIRSQFGVSVLDGKIYAIGGWMDTSRLKTVEMFDGARWTEIGQGMNTERAGVAVGALNGSIYAVGGHNGQYLKTVEKMNLATGVWEFVASMNVARFGHCVAVLDKRLYAIGGENWESGTWKPLKSVEVYDPDLDRWTTVADLNDPRSNFGAVVYGGQIYVVGGYNPSHDTTDVYNPHTGTWSILPAKMSSGRFSYGVTLV